MYGFAVICKKYCLFVSLRDITFVIKRLYNINDRYPLIAKNRLKKHDLFLVKATIILISLFRVSSL